MNALDERRRSSSRVSAVGRPEWAVVALRADHPLSGLS